MMVIDHAVLMVVKMEKSLLTVVSVMGWGCITMKIDKDLLLAANAKVQRKYKKIAEAVTDQEKESVIGAMGLAKHSRDVIFLL
jgi:hypothetical protein